MGPSEVIPKSACTASNEGSCSGARVSVKKVQYSPTVAGWRIVPIGAGVEGGKLLDGGGGVGGLSVLGGVEIGGLLIFGGVEAGGLVGRLITV